MGLGSDSKNTKLISLKDLLTDSYSLAGSINDTESKAASTLVNIKDAIFKTSDELKHEQVMDRIRLGFKTNRELHEFFVKYLNLNIPHKKNCFENHQAPFDFIADALLDRYYNQFVIGSRGSGKSYLAGLVMWMLGNRHPLFDGKIVAGSQDQAMRSYEAMQDFWSRAGDSSKEVLVDGYDRKTFTKWKTGANVDVLASSSKRARGGHPNVLEVDELDEVDFKLYMAVVQQPMSKNNIPARLIALSTYHRLTGTVARLMGDASLALDEESAEDEARMALNFKLMMRKYFFCIFEVLEPCKDYVCSTCPLTSYCPGVHMKDAVGYYKISDFVQKIQSLSRYSLEAEWFCRRPDRKGLVLADYRDSVNTLDIGYIEGLPVYVSIDFGFTHNSPYVVGFFHEVENFKLHDGRIITGTIMFNEIYRVPKTNKDIIEEVKALPYCSNPSKIIGVADSAEQDLIREWKQNGFRINSVSKKSGSILSGLDKLVGKISPAQGSPSFYVSKKCRGFLKEKDNYKWGNKGEPLDEDNHCFIAGTLVLTDKGEIPIERIKVGDKVLTRTGFQKILWAGSTGIKEVYSYRINGKDLICTDTHPIYTENRGFIPIKHLAQLDIICMREKTFQLINTDSLLYVQEHVAHREGRQEVYNLQVENSPEFFANSILVHNSIDMTRYYLTSLKSRSWSGKGISIV